MSKVTADQRAKKLVTQLRGLTICEAYGVLDRAKVFISWENKVMGEGKK